MSRHTCLPFADLSWVPAWFTRLALLVGGTGVRNRAFCLLVALFIALPTTFGWQPGSASAAAPDRGGVAVVGTDSQAKNVAERLDRLNLNWYYDYSSVLDGEPQGYTKVGVLRGGEKNRTDVAKVADQARRHPGHYWIIFNEPDLVGQDFVSDEFLAARGQSRFDYYAELYHGYVTTIKAADPTAKAVAPNLFNWQGNYRGWLDAFRNSYRTRYGAEPPVDVWALHLYSYDPSWKNLPVIDLDYSKLLYRDFRAYVQSIPGQASAPIWVTEVGTIWGYRDLTMGPDSLYRGSDYAWPEIASYLADLLPWLDQQGVDRWFLFGTNPVNDPWAGVPNALFLMDEHGRLTQAGKVVTSMTVIQASRK